MFRLAKPIFAAIVISVTYAACQPIPLEPEENLVNPDVWPRQETVMVRDAEIERRIDELISKMTLEEKVGQVMQADINEVTPEQVRELNLGSVLNGGGSAPDKNLRNTPDSWLALADEFWEASTDTSDGGVGIPAIWGTDAMHGHSNVVGATLFPHNIGLGAANDPELMYEIGRITALEILTTGLDWTFAPTVAVVRNDRWGRTYEGYSEDPQIVAAYAPRIIEGIQGKYGTDAFLDENHILATAKHFVGDGGTVDGVDQGDNIASEAELRDIHAAGYPPSIAAGIQTVMASYNSFHGHKLHGMKTMLNDVLVDRMGFDGFVVGDWNGHGQVRGCDNDSCAQSLNAGLDMFMVPKDFEDLYYRTIKQVKSGEISQQRLEEAVARILRVKMRAGIMYGVKPSDRKHAGDWSLLAAPEHRTVARDAVRKSLVLLKNEEGILPLAANTKVLVAGDGAHDIGKQTGGWTLSWQGTGNLRKHFPNATSIFEGIRETVQGAGGQAILSEKGKWDEKPDVAIVVFGEDPYAEGVGDRDNVDFNSDKGLKLLKKFTEAGIPTVSIFLSGRPMWVNPELNLSNAFVAAWLPGSEGIGIADVLFSDADGNSRFDFTGRLSFSWPATPEQAEVNVGDSDYQPLFPYGYGLSYDDVSAVAELSEEAAQADTESTIEFVGLGGPIAPWNLILRDSNGDTSVTDIRGTSQTGMLNVAPADYKRQEDSFIAGWNGSAGLVIQGDPVNLHSQLDENQVMEIHYLVLEADAGQFSISMGEGELDFTEQLKSKAGSGWQTVQIGLSCFAEQGTNMESVGEPVVIRAEGMLKLQVSSIKLTDSTGEAGCAL